MLTAVGVFVAFLVSATRYLTWQLKEDGFILAHSFGVQPLTVGEVMAAGTWGNWVILSMVRKNRVVNAGAQLTFSFYFSD